MNNSHVAVEEDLALENALELHLQQPRIGCGLEFEVTDEGEEPLA